MAGFRSTAENGFLPVCTGTEFAWIGKLSSPGYMEQIRQIIFKGCKLRKIHHWKKFPLSLGPVKSIIGKSARGRPSFFGSDNDHSVCCTATINRGCRSVFEYVNRFDIIWIQTCEHTETGFLSAG